MTRFAMMAAVALLAAGCGSSNPNSPSTQPNTITFTAALNAANEVPPVTNEDANARGTGTFKLNLTRDASGNITDATGDFTFSVTGFPAGTQIILMHIHGGGPGINGQPVVNSGLTAATPIVLPDGSATNQTITNRPVGATVAQQIIADPNAFYFNIHSVRNGGGAARAQLVKQ
jgi:hypothetical protein